MFLETFRHKMITRHYGYPETSRNRLKFAERKSRFQYLCPQASSPFSVQIYNVFIVNGNLGQVSWVAFTAQKIFVTRLLMELKYLMRIAMVLTSSKTHVALIMMNRKSSGRSESIVVCFIPVNFLSHSCSISGYTLLLSNIFKPPHCLFFLDMYHFMKVCTNLFFPASANGAQTVLFGVALIGIFDRYDRFDRFDRWQFISGFIRQGRDHQPNHPHPLPSGHNNTTTCHNCQLSTATTHQNTPIL